jgi:putative hydrolase of the HAD superfamily
MIEILKSDVLPVLAIGGHAVHIPPYHLGSRKIDHNIEQGLMKNYRGFDEVKITECLLLKVLDLFFFILRDI